MLNEMCIELPPWRDTAEIQFEIHVTNTAFFMISSIFTNKVIIIIIFTAIVLLPGGSG